MEQMVKDTFKIVARVEAGRVQNVEFFMDEKEAKYLAFDYGTFEVHNGDNVRMYEDLKEEEKDVISDEVKAQLPIAKIQLMNKTNPEAPQTIV